MTNNDFLGVDPQKCSEKEIQNLVQKLSGCSNPQELFKLLSFLHNIAMVKAENCRLMVNNNIIFPLISLANTHNEKNIRTQALALLTVLSYTNVKQATVSNFSLHLLIQLAKEYSMSTQILDSLHLLVSENTYQSSPSSNTSQNSTSKNSSSTSSSSSSFLTPSPLSTAALSEMLDMLAVFLEENESKCKGKKNEVIGVVSRKIIEFVGAIIMEETESEEDEEIHSEKSSNSSSSPPSLFPFLTNFIRAVENVEKITQNRIVSIAAIGFLGLVKRFYPKRRKYIKGKEKEGKKEKEQKNEKSLKKEGEAIVPKLVPDSNDSTRNVFDGKFITFNKAGCCFLDYAVCQGIVKCEVRFAYNQFGVCDSSTLAQHFAGSLCGNADCSAVNGGSSIYYGSQNVIPNPCVYFYSLAVGLEVDMTTKKMYYFRNGKMLPYTVSVKPASVHFGFYSGTSSITIWEVISFQKLKKTSVDSSVNCQSLTWT